MPDTLTYEEEAGLMPTIRRHPLASAAVAFGLGAVIAGLVSSRAHARSRSGRVARVADRVGRIVETAVSAPQSSVAGPSPVPAVLKQLAFTIAMPIGATLLRNILLNAVDGVGRKRT